MKVLFCGLQFDSAFHFTNEEICANSDISIELCQCSSEEVATESRTATVLIPLMSRIDSSIIENAANLKLIMQFGVGLEGVDINYATHKKVFVCNIPGDCGNAQSCAEHAIFLLLCLFRRFTEVKEAISSQRIGVPTGSTIYGSKMMIYGFGAIGRQLLARLLPFEPSEITIVRRVVNEGELEDLETKSKLSMLSHDFVVNSSPGSLDFDVVFFCCTLRPENVGLINDQFLCKFSSPVYLINVARGGLFNMEHLRADLSSSRGKIRGLGTDVFPMEPCPPDEPILANPKVIATPHIAGVTERSYRSMAKLLAENIIRVYKGETPIGAVNQPPCL